MNDNRLLIVDDDQDTCSNLSDILTDCGYSVDIAYRGQVGLDLLKQYPYRLALLDYKLPCMTGVELFTRMRQVQIGIVGLLITAFCSAKTNREALDGGLQQVIDKPVDMSQLVSLIARSCPFHDSGNRRPEMRTEASNTSLTPIEVELLLAALSCYESKFRNERPEKLAEDIRRLRDKLLDAE